MGFLDALGETAKSFGGAVVAPVGAVWDIAQMPFDSKDDSFGTVVNALSHRGGDILDPILNQDTVTGFGVGKAMQGMNWALREGVSEPISTAFTMGSYADYKGGGSWWSKVTDGDAWNKAYEIAQRDNAGEAFSTMLMTGSDTNPLEYASPFEEKSQLVDPLLANGIALGANVVGSWYLDPAVIAGKLLQVRKANVVQHALNPGERANAYSLMTSEASGVLGKAGLARQGAMSRTDRYLEWVGGKNALQRPLEAPEILYGSPELRKYAAEPHVIAGLLADANKLGDDVLRRDAQRRILAVAAGDTSQVQRLKAEVAGSGAIADQLRNMVKQGSIDLKILGLNPAFQHNPVFIQHLESQIENLDSAKAVTRFMDDWSARLDQQLGLEGSMKNLPGVHRAGKSAILRQNDMGKGRAIYHAAQALDQRAADFAAKAQSQSSLFQQGVHSLPFLAVKTVGMAASPWSKFPVIASDALRQQHFTGVANIHDWGGSVAQFDSMMQMSSVTAGDRLKMLSEAYIAKSEPEKMRVIDKVESLAMNSLAKHFGEKYGTEINKGYIENLMTRHAEKRGATLAQLRGRTYSATEMPDALRSQSMQNLGDAARQAEGRGSFSAPAHPRVDQVNDDGTLLSLPLFETQLGNSVPLLDMGVARKLLERDQSYLSRLSRSWASDQLELGRLNALKGAGHSGLDRAIAMKNASLDYLVDAGQRAMRMWKFSVLFRLGYPLRVIADDHMRIWTQVNAGAFYLGNGTEAAKNFGYNQFGRKAVARHAVNDMRVRRQELLDELEGDRMVHHPERLADFASLKRSIGGHEATASRLRKQLEDAETKHSLGVDHGVDLPALRAKVKAQEDAIAEKRGGFDYYSEQLGDYGPDDLKRQISELDDQIRAGSKPLRDSKRTIGTKPVMLPDGILAPGAYQGTGGNIYREAASSEATFTANMKGTEDRMYQRATAGSHRTIQGFEPGHLDAWGDVLNYQFRMSPVAMHFVKGGSVEDFARWVEAPEQAALRGRLPHFAHDAEDWGNRVQSMVHDYIPTDELAQRLIKGKVSRKFLATQFQDPALRPAVHGRVAAENIGIGHVQLGIGRAVNRIYKALGETPTDHLSRHPFFNTVYKTHLNDLYEVKRIGYAAEGRKFTPEDVQDLAQHARKLALHDVKRTLFDISAHSHAAHMMRFISPFFAAHQEVLMRWWRIAGDNPAVVRRFQQAFDLPRSLNIVVDENGDLVKPGDPISKNHHLLLQLPAAFGGPNADPSKGTAVQAKWQIGENAFNLILQSGLTNPGVGPIVSVPLEWAARHYADQKEIARVARVLNPYPPNSPFEAALPATAKRLSAALYGQTGFDPLFGVGQREYNNIFSQNVQDLMADFQLKMGREPGRQEAQDIMQRAGRESNTDSWLRFLNNSLSPFPANPGSKYAAVQEGWYKIQEQARAEGRDYDWAYAQFKEKWGAVYMPLIYSSANNPAHVDSTAAAVAGIKRYRGVLNRVDPSLTRAVIGAYAEDLGDGMNEYSADARNFLRSATMKPGDPGTYYNYDSPAAAMKDQMARRGWQQYGELTGALTALAQQQGLNSYRDSSELMAIKRAGVDKLRQSNYAFDEDYGNFDSTEYDRTLDDMRTIVKSPTLMNDPERQDMQTLALYLQVHDAFAKIIEQRSNAGYGGADAQANAPIRQVYTNVVMRLVESNTQFEQYIYNGTIERDPLLVGD